MNKKITKVIARMFQILFMRVGTHGPSSKCMNVFPFQNPCVNVVPSLPFRSTSRASSSTPLSCRPSTRSQTSSKQRRNMASRESRSPRADTWEANLSVWLRSVMSTFSQSPSTTRQCQRSIFSPVVLHMIIITMFAIVVVVLQ